MNKKGTIVIEKFESNILKGNPLGDPYEREFPVYLPYNYYLSKKKFPVVFLLSGFTGHGLMNLNYSFLSENIKERLDRLIGSKKVNEMIVVMPDCITKYGGSQFINSASTGKYEDYIIKELIPYIDKKYNTLNQSNFRAVCGKSSGGYGALVLAMKHPNIFGLTLSIAGDMYFEYCYQKDFPEFVKDISKYGRGHVAVINFIKREINYNQPKPRSFHNILNIIGMSSCYSPDVKTNKAKNYKFDLPFDIETGEIDKKVFQKWLTHDPIRLVEKYKNNLKKLKLLYFEAGNRDEFNLNIGAKIFAKRLKENNIKFIFDEFDGGHFNIQYRYDKIFEIISKHIKIELNL